MFFRLKKSGPRSYLQIVENRWEDGVTRQHVIATVGRVDELAASGALASLLASGARFCDQVMLLSALEADGPQLSARRIGAPLLFGRLWEDTGCRAVLEEVVSERAFEFPVERAVFTAVLHRLLISGSDRAPRLMGQRAGATGALAPQQAPDLPLAHLQDRGRGRRRSPPAHNLRQNLNPLKIPLAHHHPAHRQPPSRDPDRKLTFLLCQSATF
ncbi:hypothetical protein [Azospirillum sp.]|uniref:hypothetical protein n=1 Tax=Azospirillum sp. TaxID=34012 RepID=UPI003D704B23